MIDGTMAYFVSELGNALDDRTVSVSADGTIVSARGTWAINASMVKVLRRLLAAGARPETLARRATLAEDSNDDDVSFLPYRTFAVLGFEDSSGTLFPGVYSRKRIREAGVIVERQASTTAANYLPAARWWGFARPDTAYAWVIEEPAKMSHGAGAVYTSTTVTLATTPTVGDTIENDDYYNGALVAVASGSYSGQIREVSDYVASTRVATVATWTNTPSTSDQYSIMCPLPRVTWDAVVTEAAYRIAATVDARWLDQHGVGLAHLKRNRDEAFEEALRVLAKPIAGAGVGPRQKVLWIF